MTAATRRLTVIVCRGPTCGEKRGSEQLYRKLEQALGLRAATHVTLDRETCFGQCQRGPNILVCDTDELGGTFGRQPGFGSASAVLYTRMNEADLERIIERHLMGGVAVRAFLNRPPFSDE